LNIVGKDTMLQQTVARSEAADFRRAHLDGHERAAGRRRPQTGSRSRAQTRADRTNGAEHRGGDWLAAIHVRMLHAATR